MARLWRLSAFRNAYLGRGLLVWVGVRLALAVGQVVNPSAAEEALLLGIVVVAVSLDAWRRREALFLGNLGIPAVAISLCALPLALLAELIVP